MSETNLLLCQWLCVESVWGDRDPPYCCLSCAAVITLNHSVIGLVAAFFHSAISFQKKIVELIDTNKLVVSIGVVSIVTHISMAQTQYARHVDVTLIRFEDE